MLRDRAGQFWAPRGGKTSAIEQLQNRKNRTIANFGGQARLHTTASPLRVWSGRPSGHRRQRPRSVALT